MPAINANLSSHKLSSRPARTNVRRSVLVTTAIVLATLIVAFIVALPIVHSKNVAFYVGKDPVTQAQYAALMADLPFDKTSNFYGSRVELLNSSDSTAQYVESGLKNEAAQRFVIMYAEAAKASASGVAVSASQLDAAVKAYVKDHTASSDSAADIKSLQTPAMKSYIELLTICNAYEDNLTKNITVSENEIKDFYATWRPDYTDKTGKQLSLQQAYRKVRSDALATKRLQVITSERQRLLKSHSNAVQLDTRYKSFLRRWDTTFGIEIPDALNPMTVNLEP